MESTEKWKKFLKLAILLIASVVISSASAAVYDQLFQSGTITAYKSTLQWIDGDNSTDVGLTINGATCSMNSLSAPVGGAKNWTDPVRLNNTGSSPRTFKLVVDSISGNTSHLEYIYIRLYNSTGSYMGTYTVWNGTAGGESSTFTIAANDWWRFEWDIKWNTSSTESSSVNVTIRVDVTG